MRLLLVIALLALAASACDKRVRDVQTPAPAPAAGG